MTPEQKDFLHKSKESIAASKHLLEGEFYGFCITRAYYAMFYAAEAFLEEKGLAFSKHSAVISAFGQQFVKTGRVPVVFHRYLIEAEKNRLMADYNTVQSFQRNKQKRFSLRLLNF